MDKTSTPLLSRSTTLMSCLSHLLSSQKVFRRIYRMFRGEEEAYNAMVAHMSVNTVVGLDTNMAVLAAELSIEHRLALADSIIYATARSYSATLWTQDADFEGLEDVRYIPHWSRTQG